jgi:hypothetical protein
LNVRLSHFVNNQQCGCTFCSLNNVGNIPDETFSHLFYDCETTKSWHEKFLREHFPANLFNNDAEKKLFLVTGFNNRYPKNLFLTVSVLLFQYCIWEAKLKKKIPSFHTLNEDFLDICRKFIWSNNVAHNCCTSNNFPLRRNLGYEGAADHAAGREQDGGPPQQQGHQGHARRQHRHQHRQLQRHAPRPPPPQMNNSMKIVKELDPDGILDKDTNSDSFVKRDGEAVDPCHTLSSSESEEEDTADVTEKEMEVDQPAAPILTAPPVPTGIINVASTGSESGMLPDPAHTAAGTAALSVTTPTMSQSGSGPGSSTEAQDQKKDPGVNSSLNRVDPN